jgi:hypothetical protein
LDVGNLDVASAGESVGTIFERAVTHREQVMSNRMNFVIVFGYFPSLFIQLNTVATREMPKPHRHYAQIHILVSWARSSVSG